MIGIAVMVMPIFLCDEIISSIFRFLFAKNFLLTHLCQKNYCWGKLKMS